MTLLNLHNQNLSYNLMKFLLNSFKNLCLKFINKLVSLLGCLGTAPQIEQHPQSG